MKLRQIWQQLRPPVRIGCTVSEERVVAIVQRRKLHVAAEAAVPQGAAPVHERVALAFRDVMLETMRHCPAGTRAAVRIAVMPPLAQLRLLPFPPMRAEARARVLTRDASRYFFGVREPQVAAGAPGAGRNVAQIVAAAIPAALHDALRSALPANIRLGAIVPAGAAWASEHAGTVRIQVTAAGVRHVIRSERGRIVDVRQRRVCSDGQSADADAVLYPDAERAAAASVWRTRHLALLSPRDWQNRRLRRQGRIRATAAAALIALAAGSAALHASLRQQISQLRADRDALRPALLPALAQADSLQRIEERLESIRPLQRGSQWSGLVPMIARRLPPDVQIIYILAASDSVHMRVSARAAADVLPELRSAPLLHDVRIAGAIERDLTDPDASIERFDVAARVRTPPMR